MAPSTYPTDGSRAPSTATVHGIDVHYLDLGQGPPVLLVHGHPFDHTMWQPQIRELLAHGYRVIAPDLRGYGHSTVVAGLSRMEVFARDLHALLEHLGLNAVHVVGACLGGQVALELYRLFPDHVESLTLVATDPRPEIPEGRQQRQDLAERLSGEGMAPYADEVLVGMMSAENVHAMPETAERVRAMMCRTPPEGAAAALRGWAQRQDHVCLLRHISAPTLLVVGSLDSFTPPGLAETMHLKVVVSVVSRVEGAGHLPNLERPEVFTRSLLDFLERVRGSLPL